LTYQGVSSVKGLTPFFVFVVSWQTV